MAEDSDFVMVTDDGLAVRLRLTPKAARTAMTGLRTDAAGVRFLTAGVTAAPEKGKANAALVKLLAKEWDLPKTAITVVSGLTDRNKTLRITGGDGALATRLVRWAEAKWT